MHLINQLKRGIGVHHSGMLPLLKVRSLAGGHGTQQHTSKSVIVCISAALHMVFSCGEVIASTYPSCCALFSAILKDILPTVLFLERMQVHLSYLLSHRR
jgi:hypothetical protein